MAPEILEYTNNSARRVPVTRNRAREADQLYRRASTGRGAISYNEINMKILIADDHPLIREALHHTLKQLEQSVTILEAPDSAKALEQVENNEDMDLVILDLDLPGIGGFAALSELRKRFPMIPVVIFSAHDQHENVTDALDRGASGFISKKSSNDIILGALRLVLSGGIYLPPESMQRTLLEETHTRPRILGPYKLDDLGLTTRQLQVLALVAQGKSNKLICRELGLAEGTVKIHVSAILKALRVNSRAEAIVELNRLGVDIENLAT